MVGTLIRWTDKMVVISNKDNINSVIHEMAIIMKMASASRISMARFDQYAWLRNEHKIF